MIETIGPCYGQHIDVSEIRAETIKEVFSKIDKLTVYYAGDKDGNAITPKMLVKEDVIKLLEQLKEQKNEMSI